MVSPELPRTERELAELAAHPPGYCAGSAKQPILPPAVDNQRDYYKGECTRKPLSLAPFTLFGSRVRSPSPVRSLSLVCSSSRTLASGHGCNRTASDGVSLSHLAGESRVRYPISIRPLS